MEKKIESTGEGNDKETLVTLMAKSYIAEDCPGLLFDWNYTAVSLFVEKANSFDMNYLQDDEDTVRPPWFKSWPLTSESFMMDLVDYLNEAVGAQSFGLNLISANDFIKLGCVISRLAITEVDPYMQEVMKAVRKSSPDVGFLAKKSLLYDKTKIERLYLDINILDGELENLFE